MMKDLYPSGNNMKNSDPDSLYHAIMELNRHLASYDKNEQEAACQKNALLDKFVAVLDEKTNTISEQKIIIQNYKMLKEQYDSIVHSKAYRFSVLLRKALKMLHVLKPDHQSFNNIINEGPTISRTEGIILERKKDSLTVADYKLLKWMYSIADFINNSNRVNALTVRFFEDDGSNFYGGGAERYLLDLKEACDELGACFSIYQYASYQWCRFIRDTLIIGICSENNDGKSITPELTSEMDAVFDATTSPDAIVNIYSGFNIHVKKSITPTIGISHGIFWDDPNKHFRENEVVLKTYKDLIESASLCQKMLSVDTNTCNWFQTIDYELGRKIHYIPNYVDCAEFHPRENYLEVPGKIIITYPRRLYAPRGMYAVLDVIDSILLKYQNVEFHFVGRGFEEDTQYVEKKMQLWPDRIKWYYKMPEEMYEVYQHSDISLIPTMHSEGTSLSCLEALSSGNAVIATRIGGLTDLIINGYNGILTEPHSDSIYKAIVELIEDPDKLANMKKNARESAFYFTKDKWKSAIKSELSGYMKRTGNEPVPPLNRVKIELKSKDSLEIPKVRECIGEFLISGWFVFVCFDNNVLKEFSYKRIQFINPHEDLYFEFEKTLTEENII